VFDPYATVATRHGASTVSHFTIDGNLFLAYSRYRGTSRQASTNSYIFRLEDQNFKLHQTIRTKYFLPSHVRKFSIDRDHYLAVYLIRTLPSRLVTWRVLLSLGVFDPYATVTTRHGASFLSLGVFDPYATVATRHGASTVSHFTIDGNLFLAYSRYRGTSRQASTNSYIFRLEDQNFKLHQTIRTKYFLPSHVRSFNIDGDHYLAIPYAITMHRTSSVVVVSKYDQESQIFQPIQELKDGKAHALSTLFFEIDSAKFLAVTGFKLLEIYKWTQTKFRLIQRLAVGRDYIPECSAFTVERNTFLVCAVWGYYKKSLAFRWTGDRFMMHQQLPIGGYISSAETMHMGNDTFLLFLAKRQRNFGANLFNTKSPIYKFNKETQKLELFDELDTLGASASRPFTIGDDTYIVVTQSAYRNALIFKFQEGKFVKYQEVLAPYSADASFFTYKRIHYIAFATNYFNNSPVFVWA
ncbi:predicted protein, partial [Nematostella vectensis]